MNATETQPKLIWQCRQFEQLLPLQLYQILQLRTEVFVMEQDCAYQDMDDSDQQAYHLTAYRNSELICYARLLPPGQKYTGASIGRVISKQSVRGEGFGKLVMRQSISHCSKLWPDHSVFISAQKRLEKFYNNLGFQSQSEPYMEDGIPHLEMLLESTAPIP